MRSRTSSALLAATTLATLAACTDASRLTEPTSATFSASRSPELNSSNRHLFHTREYFAREDASNGAARSARPSSGTGISYHGGTVLQKGTNVVAIYWGSPAYPVGYQSLPSGAGAGSGDASLIGTFLSSLGNVTDVAAGRKYFNINSTYTDGSGLHISPTVAYTAYWNTNGSGAPIPVRQPDRREHGRAHPVGA